MPYPATDCAGDVPRPHLSRPGRLKDQHFAGRLHHLGIDRTHNRTRVILLIRDLQVRFVAATTGELLSELTINPRRDYEPQK